MTPEECKRSIRVEWMKLHRRADEGKINRSAIDGLIKSQCQDASRHNGVPWEYYFPSEND